MVCCNRSCFKVTRLRAAESAEKNHPKKSSNPQMQSDTILRNWPKRRKKKTKTIRPHRKQRGKTSLKKKATKVKTREPKM